MRPISEASSIIVASSTCCTDQSEYDKANHDQHLGTAEPELELSEKPNAKVIDRNDCHQENCHEDGIYCWADVW